MLRRRLAVCCLVQLSVTAVRRLASLSFATVTLFVTAVTNAAAYACSFALLYGHFLVALSEPLVSYMPLAHAAVQVSFHSFMVQREQWGTYWGPKELIFLIRDVDDATMTAAPAESCQSVAQRPPGGRLGSVTYTCNRLRRRFPLEIHLPRCISSQMSPSQNAKVLDPELSGELQAWAHAA